MAYLDPVSPIVELVLSDVEHELNNAMAAHGSMKSRHEAYAVIAEEVDEFWDEVKKNPVKMTLPEFDKYQADMRKELVQIAAMAVRAIIDLGLEAHDDK